MANIAQLESQLSLLLQRREELQAELQQVASEFFDKVDRANALERAGNRGEEFQQLSAEIRQLRARRVAINQQLAQIEQQIAAIQGQINDTQVQERAASAQGSPTASAVAAPEATVDPPGNTTAQLTPAASQTTGVENQTTGTNPVVTPGGRIQAPLPVPPNQGLAQPQDPPLSANQTTQSDDRGRVNIPNGNTPGVFSSDEAERSSTSKSAANKEALRQQIDQRYSSNILTTGNVLSKYSNITYQLSWYLLPKNGLEILSRARTNTLPGYYLLAQSGGAPLAAAQPQTSATLINNNVQNSQFAETVGSAGRNPNFDLDFYIDDLEIRTRYPGAGSTAAHSIVELGFSVTEPYGISLIPRLHKAVADSYRIDGINTENNFSYSRALYAMVIKFWGYRDDGTLERVVSQRGVPVEKLIPFNIVDLRFTQSSKQIEYKITGRSPASYINYGTERGVALDRYNLTGASARDVLIGKGQMPSTRTTTSANPAPANRPEIDPETPPI